MRNVRLAEVLLSIVMPSERAAATVGDLLEGAHSPLGFWWACLRTVCGAALGQLSLSTGLKAIGIAFLLEVVADAFSQVVLRVEPEASWFPWVILSVTAARPILSGYVVARWLPGRELGAWIAVALGFAAGIAMSSLSQALGWPFLARWELRHIALLLIGVLLARRRMLRQGVLVAGS